MAAPLCAPTISIDGPAPAPPALTLVGASRPIPTTDDRWINGATLWTYPRDLPDTFDAGQPLSSSGHAKDAGTPTTGLEVFGSFDVLEGITCTTGAVQADPEEWKRRAAAVLEAYEHWAIEREFWSAPLNPVNPHLAQAGSGSLATVILNSGNPTSPENGMALLEQAIADKGGNGVLHMRPVLFSQVSYEGDKWVEVDRGVARTRLGNVVVPGVGYTGSKYDATPQSGTVEWAYVTGPIEIRKTEVRILPESISEATNRGNNTTTFRAERTVLITWDQRIHAAVQIDRAYTTFTS